VALTAFVAFLPALSAGFVTWDDNRNFLDNPAYRGLDASHLRWMWTSFHMGHYVPLTWMTLGIDYELWGMDARGYHLQNLLLHAANAVLVYLLANTLLRRVRGRDSIADDRAIRWSAAACALLFAVHPLRVESVAWITERRDMLSLLFCLVSVLLYLRHTQPGETRRVWYGLSLVAFVSALLSKATSVSLPVVLAILNVYPLGRIGGASGWWSSSARRVYGELAPFVVLSLGAGVLSIVALSPPAQLSLASKIAVSAYSVAFYLWKTLLPTSLAPLYEMPRTVDPFAPRYVVSYVVGLGVTLVAWRARKRYPAVTAAWAVFLAALFPMLGLVQNGPQIAADRYTYHASPALAILAGAALGSWRQVPALARAAIAGALITILAAATWRQTDVWHDSEALWSRVLSVDSTSSVAQIAMGDLLVAQDRLGEAAEHYERGLALDPTFAIGYNNLGVILARQGKPADAVERYRQALALRPLYADAHNNWGIALSQQGDYAGAIGHFERAIALDTANADAEINLGNAFVRQQRPDSALTHYARAAGLKPNSADAFLNWGVALAQLGNLAEATARFRRAVELAPDNAEARAYLERAERMQSPRK
jgi:tetratricopeptide (TPR) repeat protein